MSNLIAKWATRGKDYLELYKGNTLRDYYYKGNGCGGGFYADTNEAAILRIENDQVKWLKMYRPSLKRTK